ncbi:efflux RND transporter periplasmic adaptor subunit [Antarcticimicrobium sediminis]|uniref:Efflux RND transporter periplasmic adaptor subunit n=1 Tax=Antarcticimicrobium sediminis TaxID=2546227 RepID=A0A4R5EYR7_9RHOB|nr:efflux RND transporter periplasmic adaptor subunit [Antarcticimicrobium sediminis]TDE40102.1 efflux RND transporter periplasmic adaptor subunit [Antarcticimicrobium sediminis]
MTQAGTRTTGGKGAEIEARLGLGQRRARRGGWFWGLALVVVVAGGFALWRTLSAGDGAAAYRTGLVQRADLVVTVTATGTVEPTNLVEISSELSGTLRAVNVDYNDAVTAGQVLATLDTTKLEAEMAVAAANVSAAEAQLVRARATLDEARDNYDRVTALDARGVSSQQSLMAQRAAFGRAVADVTVAEANLDLARAQHGLVQADLDKACICSPINGVVLDRAVDAGQIVASALSAPVLFTIAEDLTRMDVQVAVDEADIGAISEGDAVVFTVDAYDDRSFPASIRTIRFAPETVEGVVSYTAVLSVQNDDLSLRPGMTATADIIVAELSDVLAVPNGALRYAPPQQSEAEQSGGGLLGMIMPHRPEDQARASGKSVWVLRAGKPVEVPVVPGASDGSLTEILKGDLREGERVILGEGG